MMHVAKSTARSLRHYLKSRITLAALSLGVFFVWIDIAFRVNAGEFGSAPAALPERSDLVWLVVLGAASVTSFVMRFVSKKILLHPVLQLIVGSVAMSIGSTGYAMAAFEGLSSSSLNTALISGVVSGVGIPLVAGSWFFLLPSFGEDEVAVVLVEALVQSVVVMSVILLLDAASCLIAIGVLPLLAGAGSLLCSRCTDVGNRAPAVSASPSESFGNLMCLRIGSVSRDDSEQKEEQSRMRVLVILASCAIVFFLLGTIGAPATAAMRSRAFWLYDIAAAGEVILLVAILSRPAHPAWPSFAGLQRALTVLLATAIAMAPFLALVNFSAACVVLLKLTSLSAYALIFLDLATNALKRGKEKDSEKNGTAESSSDSLGKCANGKKRRTKPCWFFGKYLSLRMGYAYLVLAGVGAAMLAGLTAGELLRNMQGFTMTTFALVGIALLYALLMVASLASPRNHFVRVEHVITGRFDTEEDIARAQVEVLGQQYPSLSSREREVLTLLLQHYGSGIIADKLIVSENTVKTHVRHIYKKLGVNSRQQLISLARDAAIRDDVHR